MWAFLLGIIALLLMVSPDDAWAQESQCVFLNHSKAVLYIKFTYKSKETGEEYYEQGTGFLVDERGHAITVAHVVSARPGVEIQSGSQRIEVRVGGYSSAPIMAAILRKDQDMDLALLKLPTLAEGHYAFLPVGDSSVMDVGDRLTGLGYPQSDLAIIPSGEITSPNAIVGDELRPFWQTSLSMAGGHSGSPIFGKLGQVVGVAAAVRRKEQFISYVIPIQYASALLKNAHLSENAGPCAVYPACRHPDHGVEKYEVDENVGEWGGWRGGGYNRGAYCNDLEAFYKTKYPDSILVKVRDDEESRKTWDGQAQYKYYCEFNRKEKPIYQSIASASCLAAKYQK